MNIPNINRLWTNEVVAQEMVDKASQAMGFGRLLPKVTLKPSDKYYTYFKREISWEDAKKQGKLGEVKRIAPGAEFQELNIRDFTSDTITIETYGGKLVLDVEVFEQGWIGAENVLQEVGLLFATQIEENIIKKHRAVAEAQYDAKANETYNEFLIKAQSAFGKSAGRGTKLGILGTTPHTLSGLRTELTKQKYPFTAADEIKSYYGIDAISVEGSSTFDAGDYLEDNELLGLDVNNPAGKVLYSSHPRAISAPFPNEGGSKDWSPLIQYKRKDILDEFPERYEFFVQLRYGILYDRPELAFKGTTKYE